MLKRIKKYALACLATCAVAAPVALVVGLAVNRAITPAQTLAGVSSTNQVDFWRSIFINAMYVEDYDSLKSMASSADAVVIGRITDVGLSRVHQGDAAPDVVVFGKFTVAVDTLVSGRAEDKVEVEFIVPYLPEVAAGVIEKLAKSIPDEDLMLFLRDTEGGVHRWVNDLGVWVIREGVPTAPLAAEAGADIADRFGSAAGRYRRELEGVKALDELAIALFK